MDLGQDGLLHTRGRFTGSRPLVFLRRSQTPEAAPGRGREPRCATGLISHRRNLQRNEQSRAADRQPGVHRSADDQPWIRSCYDSRSGACRDGAHIFHPHQCAFSGNRPGEPIEVRLHVAPRPLPDHQCAPHHGVGRTPGERHAAQRRAGLNPTRMIMTSRLLVYVSLVCILGACSTPGAPRLYFNEDPYARYYTTDSGQVLRVEQDGTVLDVTCLPPEFAKGTSRKDLPHTLCGGEKIQVLGKVKKVGGEWDMSTYAIAPETGTCKP